MISSKRVISLALKWKKISVGRRRFPLLKPARNLGAVKSCINVAAKGHFAVYTCDERRYQIPLRYLAHTIFRELLQMAEEEFGLPRDGPIVLPCDSVIMEYILSMVRRGVCDDMEEALLISLGTGQCSQLSSSCNRVEIGNQLIIKGF